MRSKHPLHERHLVDAVREKIITADQYEAVMALAYTTASREAGAMPDLDWISTAQTVAAGFVAFAPAFYLMAEYTALRAIDLAAIATALAAATFTLAHLARVRHWGRAPAALLNSAAPLYLGALCGAATMGFGSPRGWWTTSSGGSLSAYESYAPAIYETFLTASIVAALSAALAAGGIWWRRKVAPAAGVAVMCLAVAALLGAKQLFNDNGATYLVLLASGGLMFGLGWRMEATRSRSGVDGAFWVHLASAPVVGLALLEMIDRERGGWQLAGLVIAMCVAYGVRYRSRLHLASAAMGVLFVPALALSEARASGWLVLAALLASATAVAVAAGMVRNQLRARSLVDASAEDTSTVWE